MELEFKMSKKAPNDDSKHGKKRQKTQSLSVESTPKYGKTQSRSSIITINKLQQAGFLSTKRPI
jgi:hypothetical protein